jgi:hypothetical protein
MVITKEHKEKGALENEEKKKFKKNKDQLA